MGVPGSANFLLAGSQGYRIERSLRFNSADSANCSRTFSSSNRKTWTWSGWLKRSALGTNQVLFSAGSVSGTYHYHIIGFNTDDKLAIVYYPDTTSTTVRTAARYRDPSAWLHIVAVWDTTQATSSDRAVLYVNGQKITAFDTATYSAQNTDGYINSTAYASGVHYVGRFPPSETQYLDGYLTEVHFIDGQALTPSSFGETDTITGVWKPKKYAGTYGTNGFYLNFSDNSGTTSTTLGKDSSGNGNNWTPNNFSVTAGAGNDSLIDTPTPYADGGNGRGNYCTWNPLSLLPNSTITNGNLDASTPVTNGGGIWGTVAFPASGKWYFEVTATSGNSSMIGISSYLATAIDAWAINPSVFYWNNAKKYVNGSDGGAYGATYTTNDVIGVAVDCDSGSVTFYKNNSSQGAISCSPSGLFPCVTDGTSGAADSFSANFGQRPFAYTPPSGFVALNTQNLPEPSIKKPNSYMDVVTYTGNGSTLTPTSSFGFSPDLVWIKRRDSTASHGLFDSVRGTTKVLYSNLTNAEGTESGVTAFNSNGFTLGSDAGYNGNGNSHVAWCWDESATPGFDIVTYTGDGTTGRAIAHSLGVAPSMMIVKCRTSGTNSWTSWQVYHSALATPTTSFLRLNETSAAYTGYSYAWGNTAPTSSNFYVSYYLGAGVNGSSDTFVAYLWSEVAGFSKFGSYTGNGSTDGPFVFLGFRPRWIMLKRSSDVGGDWHIYDTARGTYNANTFDLFPNSSSAEGSGSPTYDIDFTSGGFKLRSTWAGINNSGSTFIFAAFAEAPFKYSLAR